MAPRRPTRHVVEGPGRVRRLTAAIVVNDRLAQAAASGKPAVWQPRSADELRNLTALAQAAVGFDAARGDMLTVEDLAFDDNRCRAAVSAARTGAGHGGEFAGAGQVRGSACWPAGDCWPSGCVPRLRRAGSASVAKARPKRAPKSWRRHGAGCQAALKPPEPAELDPERIRTQEIFEQVTAHLKREPTQSSRLLQSWIHSD